MNTVRPLVAPETTTFTAAASEWPLVAALLEYGSDALKQLPAGFQADNIADDKLQAICMAILAALKRGEPVSIEILRRALPGILDGTTAERLAEIVCHVHEVGFYCVQIMDAANRRHCWDALAKAQQALTDPAANVGMIAGDLTAQLAAVDMSGDGVAFTVRTWGEVVDMDLPPKCNFLGNMFACGQVQTIFGQGGLGKSRLATNIARNQALGKTFLGVETGREPLRHLFIGSENDIHRWQVDTRCMSKGLRKSEVETLAQQVRMSTLEAAEDAFINLGDERNVKKWRDTLRRWTPDVLWCDPWGDIIEGDGFDRDVRSTLATLRTLAREVNPDCGIMILAHARTGAANIAQAVGFDAANFGKDSKALFSCSRAVVNIAPFDASESPDLCWIPAKCNDGKRPEALRIRLDSETLTYGVVEPLDVEGWQRSVKEAAKSTWQKTSVKFDATEVLKLAGTPVSKLELHSAVRALGITERDARAGIEGLLRTGRLIEKKAGLRNSKLIGTPGGFQT